MFLCFGDGCAVCCDCVALIIAVLCFVWLLIVLRLVSSSALYVFARVLILLVVHYCWVFLGWPKIAVDYCAWLPYIALPIWCLL